MAPLFGAEGVHCGSGLRGLGGFMLDSGLI